MAGRGSKPGERRGGRRKGTPNKINRDVREMLLAALHQAGGVKYLKRCARSHPAAFLALLAKILPKEQSVDDEDRVTEIVIKGGLPSMTAVRTSLPDADHTLTESPVGLSP
jgi:hypothetical protein